MCDWYHLLINQKLLNIFNTLNEWAQNLKLHTDQLPLLLQSVLKRKAQEEHIAFANF